MGVIAFDYDDPSAWPAEIIQPRREEEFFLFAEADIADVVGMLVDADKALNDATGGVTDLKSLPAQLRDLKGNAELIKELGVRGRYYTTVLNGKKYIILKGYPGLRETLKGTRYLAGNSTIVKFGIGAAGIKAAAKGNLILTIVCCTVIDVTEYLAKSEWTVSQLAGHLTVDIGGAAIATALGTLVGIGIGLAGAPVIVAAGAGIIASCAIGWIVSTVANELGLADKLANLIDVVRFSPAGQKVGQIFKDVALLQTRSQMARSCNNLMASRSLARLIGLSSKTLDDAVEFNCKPGF